MTERQLIFVYNAGSDLFSSVTDFAHKIFSPSTYHCSLCALTYGNFTVKQEWKSYIDALPLKAVFLHKDEFAKQHGLQIPLPVILIQNDEQLITIMSKDEIDACTSLPQLKEKLSFKLAQYDQHHYSNI